MKLINLKQDTKEWLDWRKSVLTATDASAILGCNPWVTPYKCWQRKLGLVEGQKVTQAMEDGKRLEPIARDKFNAQFRLNMQPAVVESEDFSFLGASLDGLEGNCILEIKCGKHELHDMSKHGIIPDYYIAQMQHQLIVTRAIKCYYYSFYNGEGVCIEVLPDTEFEANYISKARDFWKRIAFFDAPPLTLKDYRSMEDDLSWKEYTDMYLDLDSTIKSLESKKDYVRKKIIELCEEQSCEGNGLKVMKIISKGRISYEEIPEIKNVDVEKYRKTNLTSWKFSVNKQESLC